MKRILFIILTVALFGCHNDIWEELNKHAQKIQELEEYCNKLNDNIIALQTIVSALEQKDFVNSVTPIITDGVEVGYKIEFSKGTTATIYHGIDGHNPVVGVQQDTDGIYYWTLDGEWLLNADGQKIKAVGLDGSNGSDGSDGSDGITPQLKIVEDYWHISYDNGTTWTKLEKSVGKDGADGDAMFESVDLVDNLVYITLVNGTEFVLEKYAPAPELLTLRFNVADNQLALIEDIKAEVDDNVWECLIPHIVPDKKLVPVFDFEGASVWAGNTQVISGQTRLDFSKPVTLSVVGQAQDTVSYTVNVRAFNGLPVMELFIENGEGVTSKEVYKTATIKIREDITTRGPGDYFEAVTKIKGRGNSTWDEPKKPYKLKFNEKVSLFGEPADKEWVLLANYLDNSLMRNEIAMYLGKKSLLTYTTSTHYVDLFMNNRYIGTYMVAEQQKIAKNRVNVTDEGYLLEIDAKADAEDITFRINSIPQPLNIKDGSVEAVGDDAYNYIVDFMNQVEAALYGENWLDPENGWQKYMDMDSFVDWYLINEISRNNDAIFFTSCYMHHAPGGKLFMGPLWDFDLAFGNYGGNSSVSGFYIKDNIGWYVRLFSDPAFVARVKERFNYFYSIKDDIINEINTSGRYLEKSAVENHLKWDILYKYHSFGNAMPGAYLNEVNFLKQWVNNRMDWLKNAYDKM